MERFLLDPSVDFLNHGSFGALPASVVEEQDRWRLEMERQPVRFLVARLPELLARSRQRVSALLGARPGDLAFVPNATAGVGAVLQSLDWQPGDEILTTNHRYGAVGMALARLQKRYGVSVVEAPVPFPLAGPEDVISALQSCYTDNTRLLLIDQITSPTALVFPVERLIADARERGVPVLVDAAHAPGHVPVDLSALGADWWTGNLHKWAFAPRGTAVLWVAERWQGITRPPVASHGDETSFLEAFDWTGTFDPTGWVCAAAGLDAHERLGGAGLMAANHEKVRSGRVILSERLRVGLPHEDDPRVYGAMAAVQVPVRQGAGELSACNALHDALRDSFNIEVPIIAFGGQTWVRISGQAYNRVEQYGRLGDALAELIGL